MVGSGPELVVASRCKEGTGRRHVMHLARCPTSAGMEGQFRRARFGFLRIRAVFAWPQLQCIAYGAFPANQRRPMVLIAERFALAAKRFLCGDARCRSTRVYAGHKGITRSSKVDSWRWYLCFRKAGTARF